MDSPPRSNNFPNRDDGQSAAGLTFSSANKLIVSLGTWEMGSEGVDWGVGSGRNVVECLSNCKMMAWGELAGSPPDSTTMYYTPSTYCTTVHCTYKL